MSQPRHDGLMVQAGYNAGPRHAHVFGPAKSFKKNLDQTTMIEHDEDVISAMALTWAMFRSFMPSDLVEIVDGHLADAGLPKFGTRNVESVLVINYIAGDGHRLTAKGKEYNFAGSDRGPCEIILSQDYSAYVQTKHWELLTDLRLKMGAHRQMLCGILYRLDGKTCRSRPERSPRSSTGK
ncbi:hypothetical protein FB45DRAFT_756952 [Roridomyces roridus]|uniref:Uncharacterized protein n=1 Tax=Roridomyces roridus TaxID=1738132 RepID=A0AAD7BBH9_9AGAR|nr:hypothetical protein FB45DRAFT_756952 [Roridomyces roridus]